MVGTIQTPTLDAEYFKLCGHGDEEKVSKIYPHAPSNTAYITYVGASSSVE